MNELFKKELSKTKKFVKKDIYDAWQKRLNEGKLIRAQNTMDHFCSFFLPFNRQSMSIYIGHHINSGLWLPPGGHIENNESPLDTVKREMEEELGVKAKDFSIKLFNLTITQIKDKTRHCKIHYDFWYLLDSEKIDFKFDKSEFYKAGWYAVDTALTKVNQDTVRRSFVKLKKNHHTL